MPLIELENISKSYTKTEPILRNITLNINRGEFVAVTGTSGSGKSTLMNLLGLLDTQTSGEYRFDGASVSKFSERRLSQIRNRDIGFIFQSFNLIPTLTAEENVELPLIYRKVPARERRELVKNALEQVSVSHRKTHYPSQMSGGQQQRVAIARAVAASPMLILADEPTGNLDSRSGAEVMHILRKLHTSGTTVVIITHDSGIANSAEREIHIRDGEMLY